MVQEQDTGLTPEEQDKITDRILEMLAEVPTDAKPTDFGDGLRILADRVDAAPSLWGAKLHPTQPAELLVAMTTAPAVRAIAADLGATVSEFAAAGSLHTRADLDMGYVTLHLFAIDVHPRELHRPVDVTETIEEQEQ